MAGKNILVLNLTRMGDLIQTSPLLKGLKEAEPASRVTMLANVKFAGIAGFMEGVDELLTFDMRQFAVEGDAEPDVLAIYEYLDGLTRALAAKNFDMIINLSHSKISAILSMMIGAEDVRGFLSSPRGTRLVRDPWLVYFTSLLAFRKLNRLNLVDLYARGAGLSGGGLRLNLAPGEEAMEAARRGVEQAGIGPDDIVVGIQAGASREDRRWSPASFAKVADALAAERGAKIVLFGAASEKKLGDDVERAMTAPAVNMIGRTDLAGLVGWVKRLDLLITNDTGTMHIAAAVGTPVVALFFVHARAEETGPYCDGALVLQADIECAPCDHQTVCGHMSCLSYITPEDVHAAAEIVLDKEDEPPANKDLFQRVRLYRSGFHGDGAVDFRPLVRKPLDREEFFAYLYRPLFMEALPAWEAPERISAGRMKTDRAVAELAERFLPAAPGDLEAWSGRAMEGFERLAALCGEGMALAERAASPGAQPGELGTIAQRLAEIDEAIAVLGGTHEAVNPLVCLYRRRAENFEGDSPAQLSRQARLAFEWLANAAGAMSGMVAAARQKLSGK